MSENKYGNPFFPRWLKKIIKFSLITALVLGVMMIILGNIGGKSEIFKASVEDFTNELTGYTAEIASLNNIRFFPNIIIDFSGMSVFKTPEKTQIIGSLGNAQLVMSFWDVFRQNGRFKFLLAENLYVHRDVISTKDISLATLGIQKAPESDAQDGFSLFAQGRVGEYDFDVSLPLQTRGEGHGQSFNFATDRPAKINFGEAEIEGQINFIDYDIEIEPAKINLKNKNILDSGKIFIDTNRIVFNGFSQADDFKDLITYLQGGSGITASDIDFQDNGNGTYKLFGKDIVFEPQETDNPN